MTAAAIILAAGASRRLGQPKQLVLWQGEPLLRRVARLAGEAGLSPVRVILGAGAERCRKALAGLQVDVILNPAWEDGMSASIQAGMTGLPPKVDAMVFLVCDQPALDRAHLERLLAAHLGEPDRVVASRYGEIRGIPALFPRRAFPLLDRLRGDQGARALLQGLDVLEVPFPGGELDVDTPADLENLRR